MNTSTNVTSTGAQFNLLDDFETQYGANIIGVTIVRIRGKVVAVPPAATTVGQLVVAARVDDDEIPLTGGPFDVPYANWMMWEPFISVATTQEDTGLFPHRSAIIDVKAQRKLEEINEVLRLWAQVTDVGTWVLAWNLSILLKLP